MNIFAKVVKDSVYPETVKGLGKVDHRITTLEVSLPKVLLAEFNTHRTFSRNASSSRAIPVVSLTAQTDVFEPLFWGKNQSGMQSKKEEIEDIEAAKDIWFGLIDACREGSRQLAELGLHKQWANRPCDWFAMAKVLVTSTEWENFFALRDHEDAQPEIEKLAQEMKSAMAISEPEVLSYDEWHLPYVTQDEKLQLPLNEQLKISAARCCRVSYLKHDGVKPNIEEDLKLYDRLVGSAPLHASPLEHQAMPMKFERERELSGNLRTWIQYRKLVEKGMK